MIENSNQGLKNQSKMINLSKRYQTVLNAIEKHYPEFLNGLNVLDVGDYYPTLPLYIHSQNASVTVLDLDCAKETRNIYDNEGIRFISCDLNKIDTNPLPLENNSFDLIIWLEVIEHLKCSPKYVFQEFTRILKPSGLLVIGTPNAGRLSCRIRCLLGRHPFINSLKPFYFGAENFIGHRREYFNKEIDTMLNWNRYEILNRIYFNGSLSDHRKQNIILSTIYLSSTYFFKSLRWIYIVVARITDKKIYEPKDVIQKRV